MPTQHPDLFAALAAPFDEQELKTRTQAGREMTYITARTAMNRLDEVLGPENWWPEFTPGERSVMCRLTIRLPDGSTLTKADAGGYAGMADGGDDDKSGFSDSFKRASVMFGIARYLYRDGVPEFVQERVDGLGGPPSPHVSKDPESRPQPRPAPAREREREPAPQSGGRNPHEPGASAAGDRRAPQGGGNQGAPPRSGKALFAWTKDQEQRYEVGLLKYLNGWAKLQEFPARMVEWDGEQVEMAYLEAVRKLQSIQSSSQDDYEEALGN